MNIQYIGIEGAKLDNAFNGSDTLVNLLNKRLRDEVFFNELGNPAYLNNKNFYRTFDLVEGETDYKVEIKSIHEKGMAISLTCAVDTGINKYNTATSGLLILKDGDAPKFIITGIDARENKEISKKEDIIWTKVNEEITKELISELGKRIDEPYLVGEKPKDTLLTKKHNQKKMIEAKNKLYERLGYFTDYVNSFGEEQEMSM